jgi:ribose-phosphate pyrophosphokinase
MTCDLHADQIQGFFDFPVDHIYASAVFLPYLKSLNIDNLAIAAPDMGGAKRANAYARYLQCPVVICHKSREKANVVASITAIGDVAGKNIVIVDDMIDTAGTLAKAANVLKEMGPKIQWIQSYVTGNKIFCVYKAESEELIREHARKGGFPANKITEISSVISPETAK